jgi:hypothetical protein
MLITISQGPAEAYTPYTNYGGLGPRGDRKGTPWGPQEAPGGLARAARNVHKCQRKTNEETQEQCRITNKAN